jgi:hypothetical protein
LATTIFSMAQISIADMFCHQSFDRHVPFSVASIFNHCTMTNNQTLVMNNKGFTSFHHVFFCWPNLFILFKKFGDVFLVGKICFWSGTQSIFQHFCYIVTLVKLFTPKMKILGTWNDGMHVIYLYAFVMCKIKNHNMNKKSNITQISNTIAHYIMIPW